jgi:hypothetical protein
MGEGEAGRRGGRRTREEAPAPSARLDLPRTSPTRKIVIGPQIVDLARSHAEEWLDFLGAPGARPASCGILYLAGRGPGPSEERIYDRRAPGRRTSG